MEGRGGREGGEEWGRGEGELVHTSRHLGLSQDVQSGEVSLPLFHIVLLGRSCCSLSYLMFVFPLQQEHCCLVTDSSVHRVGPAQPTKCHADSVDKYHHGRPSCTEVCARVWCVCVWCVRACGVCVCVHVCVVRACVCGACMCVVCVCVVCACVRVWCVHACACGVDLQVCWVVCEKWVGVSPPPPPPPRASPLSPFSLGVEPVDHHIIMQPPRKTTDSVITKSLILQTSLSALLILLGTLWVFWTEVSVYICINMHFSVCVQKTPAAV